MPSNQVVVGAAVVQDGFMTRLAGRDRYLAIGDADLTDDAGLVPRILSQDIRDYLNQFFQDWRLLRRVEERRHYVGGTPWKDISYVIQVDTDADAVTLAARLLKEGYVMPSRDKR